MGGKARIAKEIAAVLNSLRKPGQTYIEPFCGACSVLVEMADTPPLEASDAHEDLILMWQATQKGWKPPARVRAELYRRLRHARPSALRAFVGFACSFGAKFFAGYARSKDHPIGYAGEGRRALLRKSARLRHVRFMWRSYDTLKPAGALIYCDPPYRGTHGFAGTPPFDSDRFFETMRRWSRDNTVIISECSAPTDFDPILELRAPIGIRIGRQASQIAREEYLFRMRP